MQTVEPQGWHQQHCTKSSLIQFIHPNRIMGMTTNSILQHHQHKHRWQKIYIYISWLPGLSCFHWTGPRFFWISNPKTLINSSSLCHPGMCGWGFPKPENHQTEVWLANVLMEIRPEISYAPISTTSMNQKPLSWLPTMLQHQHLEYPTKQKMTET